MCRLIETIKIKDGRIFHIEYHNRRAQQTRAALFGIDEPFDLEEKILSKRFPKCGLIKCRILYKQAIEDIQFLPYQLPSIHSLKLVQADHLDYSYKFEDRRVLKKLYDTRGLYDDVLFLKEGRLTDTYFCNVVLKRGDSYDTPFTYLLNGTMRQRLLKEQIIKQKDLSVSDLKSYDRIYLVNAMIDLDDGISLPISEIYH